MRPPSIRCISSRSTFSNVDGRNDLVEPQRERSRRLRQLLRGTPHDPLVVTDAVTTGRAYDPEYDRFRTVAKIGSGLSEQEWRALRTRLRQRAVSAKPKRVDSHLTRDVRAEPKYVA